jgi:tRNA(Ile)-lysidine synthase
VRGYDKVRQTRSWPSSTMEPGGSAHNPGHAIGVPGGAWGGAICLDAHSSRWWPATTVEERQQLTKGDNQYKRLGLNVQPPWQGSVLGCAWWALTSSMTLLDRFRANLATLRVPAGRALVAVSGGPDSVALLDLLVRSRGDFGLDLIVAHADHGIHPESARVAEQVRSLAAFHELEFELGHLALGSFAGETLARSHRYAWLEATRARVGAEVIFTAHHADDQVETVLMRVLAGSGAAGLAGMTPVQGKVVRPLLPFRRSDLVTHLNESGLEAWLDPANSDSRHLRSWIRTELLPTIRRRLPDVDSMLQRLSSHAARDRGAWDAVLDALPGLDLRTDESGISVAATTLADYDSRLTQAVILALARRMSCPLGPRRAGRVLDLLARGLSGTRVPLGSGWNAELAFGRLRIYSAVPVSAREPWVMEGLRGHGTWGRWRFRWERTSAPPRQDRAGMSAWFTLDRLIVRAWSPGERLKPLGGSGRRLVVRCFQEGRVPRSRRGSWPVLAQSDDVMWIPGVCRSDARLPVEGTEALRVDAEYA